MFLEIDVKISPSSSSNRSWLYRPEALKLIFHSSVVRFAENDADPPFSLVVDSPSNELLAPIRKTQNFQGSRTRRETPGCSGASYVTRSLGATDAWCGRYADGSVRQSQLASVPPAKSVVQWVP